MTLAFDIDGVLANFVQAYQFLIVRITGRDLFQPGDIDNPPTWFWPEMRGYTKDDINKVWKAIKASDNFWAFLTPLKPNTTEMRLLSYQLMSHHDIYFITNRMGVHVKWQTEVWLERELNWIRPTVLLSEAKGDLCRALHIDAYIDDKLENAQDVAEKSPSTRNYLLDCSYNRVGENTESGYRRVDSLAQFFEFEGIR